MMRFTINPLMMKMLRLKMKNQLPKHKLTQIKMTKRKMRISVSSKMKIFKIYFWQNCQNNLVMRKLNGISWTNLICTKVGKRKIYSKDLNKKDRTPRTAKIQFAKGISSVHSVATLISDKDQVVACVIIRKQHSTWRSYSATGTHNRLLTSGAKMKNRLGQGIILITLRRPR